MHVAEPASKKRNETVVTLLPVLEALLLACPSLREEWRRRKKKAELDVSCQTVPVCRVLLGTAVQGMGQAVTQRSQLGLATGACNSKTAALKPSESEVRTLCPLRSF